MKEYKLKTFIPTYSEAKGIFYNGDLYFSSSTYIYKYSQYEYSVIGNAKETVIDFNIGKKNLVLTKEKLYLNNKNYRIGSLNVKASCMASNNKYIALGCLNILEIWYVPNEYKFTLFELHSKNAGHFQEITCITFFTDEVVITASNDCTIRTYNIKTQKSKKICNTRSPPIGVYVQGDVVIVVCTNGAIQRYKIEEDFIDKIDVIYTESKNIASAQYKDYIAVFTNSKENNFEIYKNGEKVHSVRIHHNIDEMDFYGDSIAMRSASFVGLYNIVSKVFVLEIDLPKFTSFAINKDLIAVGCSDKKVRVYEENRILKTLEDENITHSILNVHYVKNSIISVCSNGRISVWDYNNSVCYRSFAIDVRISLSAMSTDGILLFIADFDSYSIRVVDLQRSKEIDNLTGHEGPVFKMCYGNGYLFTLSYDKTLRRWDIYTQTSVVLEIPKIPVGMSINHNKLCVSTNNEIFVYDTELNYETSFMATLKARKRNEMFISEKPVDYLDLSFDNEFIIGGGESNAMKIISVSSGEMIQRIQASKNREWENYKEKLGKESNKIFDKEKIIEVLGIKHSNNLPVFYFMTREGISIYEVYSVKFSPINLDVKQTPDAIQKYINDSEYLKAMIASLRVNEYEIIKNVVLVCPTKAIDFVVKHLSDELAEVLRRTLSKMMENGKNYSIGIKWLKSLLYYFASSKTIASEYGKIKMNVDSTLKLGKINKSLFKNILENYK